MTMLPGQASCIQAAIHPVKRAGASYPCIFHQIPDLPEYGSPLTAISLFSITPQIAQPAPACQTDTPGNACNPRQRVILVALQSPPLRLLDHYTLQTNLSLIRFCPTDALCLKLMCEYLINGWICWILQLLQGKDVFPVDGADEQD